MALKLINLAPSVREVFRITGLDRALHMSGHDDDPPTHGEVFAKIKPWPSGGTTVRDVRSRRGIDQSFWNCGGDGMASIKAASQGDVLVIRIEESRLMDADTVQRVNDELAVALQNSGRSEVLLHLAQVTSMSSAAFGMLLRASKTCKERGMALKISNVPPVGREVFQVTGLGKLFEIYPDANDAMARVPRRFTCRQWIVRQTQASAVRWHDSPSGRRRGEIGHKSGVLPGDLR